MPDAKNTLVESVAWNVDDGTAEDTGRFLAGSDNGTIYEAQLKTVDDHCRTKKWKQVTQLRSGAPICGLEFQRIPGRKDDAIAYFAMAVTADPSSRQPMTSLYMWTGGDTFERLLTDVNPKPNLPGSLPRSELRIFHKHSGGRHSPFFAVLSQVGIYHGRAHPSASGTRVADHALIPFPSRAQSRGDTGAAASGSGAVGGAGAGIGTTSSDADVDEADVPVSIGVTEFHFILLYDDSVAAVSKISRQIVWQYGFPEAAGMMQRLAPDPAGHGITLWAVGERHVYCLNVRNEKQDVWKLYLEKALGGEAGKHRGETQQDFDDALAYCEGNKEAEEKVRLAHADFLFANGQYVEAAEKYAKTSRPFEEVALKFSELEDHSALKTFLVNKLHDSSQRTQKVILCTWLTEIYLDKLNEFPDELDDGAPDDVAARRSLLHEFRTFLKDYHYHSCLDPATTFNLISSHGRINELLFYADLIGDFDRVLAHHMQRKEYGAALEVLADLPSEDMEKEKAADFFYKFSPTLMLEEPERTVSIWLTKKFLDPTRLIPALVRYGQQRDARGAARSGDDQAIRYLEAVSVRHREPAIHNYLLSLYAKDDDEDRLIDFITQQVAGRATPIFDLKYALRVCMRKERLEACVHIYGAMGLYEEAVQLALQVSIDLATQYANKPREDPDDEDGALCKKLWLKIAQHVLGNRPAGQSAEEGVQAALDMLREGVLKIEDVLPFFPPDVRLDKFRDEVCTSLDEVNDRVELLKDKMEEYKRSADRVRDNIKQLRNRVGVVKGSQQCEVCHQVVLSRTFYLFPCEHAFHADCLVAKVMPHLPRKRQQQVSMLFEKIQSIPEAAPGASPLKGGARSSAAAASSLRGRGGAGGDGTEKAPESATASRAELQAQMDEFVAKECLFCGDIMINSVSEPLGDDVDDDAEWDV